MEEAKRDKHVKQSIGEKNIRRSYRSSLFFIAFGALFLFVAKKEKYMIFFYTFKEYIIEQELYDINLLVKVKNILYLIGVLFIFIGILSLKKKENTSILGDLRIGLSKLRGNKGDKIVGDKNFAYEHGKPGKFISIINLIGGFSCVIAIPAIIIFMNPFAASYFIWLPVFGIVFFMTMFWKYSLEVQYGSIYSDMNDDYYVRKKKRLCRGITSILMYICSVGMNILAISLSAKFYLQAANELIVNKMGAVDYTFIEAIYYMGGIILSFALSLLVLHIFKDMNRGLGLIFLFFFSAILTPIITCMIAFAFVVILYLVGFAISLVIGLILALGVIAVLYGKIHDFFVGN